MTVLKPSLTFAVLWLFACDGADVSRETLLIAPPSDSEGLAAHTTAWSGSSRPALDVRKPAGAPELAPPQGVLERLNARPPATTRVVLATVEGLESVQWELPRPDLRVAASAIMTRVDLAVEETLCGAPASVVTAYYRGGRLPSGEAEIHFHEQPLGMEVGATGVFVLIMGDHGEHILHRGARDILWPSTAPGTFATPGGDVSSETVAGACP